MSALPGDIHECLVFNCNANSTDHHPPNCHDSINLQHSLICRDVSSTRKSAHFWKTYQLFCFNLFQCTSHNYAKLYRGTNCTSLPPIQQFNGEETTDGEMFQQWHEQFEAVAQLASWTDHGKLVDLTTRLKGRAYTFYRSCTPEQHYNLLVAELKNQFSLQPFNLNTFTTDNREQGSQWMTLHRS